MTEKDSFTDKSHGKEAAVDWFYCSRCDKTLLQDEKTEHDDWHMAQELQAEDQAASEASQRPPAYAAPAGPPRMTTTTNVFVTFPSGYTGAESFDHRQTNHHRNVLTAASDVRARDEV